MISSKNSSIPVSCSVKALGFIKEIDSTSPFEKIQSSNYYQLLFLTRQSNYLKDPFKEIMHENSRSFSIYLKNEKSVVIQIDTLVPQHFGHLLVLRSLSIERVIRAVVLVSCSCYKELGIWNNLKEQIMNMEVVDASTGPCRFKSEQVFKKWELLSITQMLNNIVMNSKSEYHQTATT